METIKLTPVIEQSVIMQFARDLVAWFSVVIFFLPGLGPLPGPDAHTMLCRATSWLGGLGQKCGLSGGSARGHG